MSVTQRVDETSGQRREHPPRPGVGADPTRNEAVAEREVERALLSTIDEGRRRLSRRTVPLLATGAVGAADVGTGVLALLLVKNETHSELLAGLAFGIGFIALSLARSELFTEDFLVPVTTVLARQARIRMLVRLWAGTLVANLIAGWAFTALLVRGFPDLQETAVRAGAYYVNLGIGGRAFALAVIGGAVITLMTWMQQGTESAGVRLVPAVTGAFLLAAGRLNHVIVNSLLMFTALHTGHAPFGYLDWARTAGWAAFGNIVGGIGLVTVLRVLQVPHKIAEERRNPAVGVPLRDKRRVDAVGDIAGASGADGGVGG